MRLPLACAALCLVSAACATNRELRLEYDPLHAFDEGRGRTVVLEPVVDLRPAVVSGQRAPSEVGVDRRSRESPALVVKGGHTLANRTTGALRRELEVLGYRVAAPDAAPPSAPRVQLVVRRFEVELQRYDARFSWQLEVAVVHDRERTSNVVEGEDTVVGAPEAGSLAHMQRVFPGFYANMIRHVVRDNHTFTGALDRAAAAP